MGWGLGAAHGGLGSEGRPGEAEGKKRSSLRECTNECPLAPRHYLLDRARWTITIHYRTSQQLTSRPDPTSRTPRWAPGAAALSPAPHGKRGIGAARSQSPGSAFSSESFRKPCWGLPLALGLEETRFPRSRRCSQPAAGSRAAGEWARTAAGAVVLSAAVASSWRAGVGLKGENALRLRPRRPVGRCRPSGPRGVPPTFSSSGPNPDGKCSPQKGRVGEALRR